MKILKMLGKEGRTTIPLEFRMKHGFRHRDIIIFEETDDEDVILIRRLPVCNSCSPYDKEDEDNEILQEVIDLMTPMQMLHAYQLLKNELTVMGDLSYVER